MKSEKQMDTAINDIWDQIEKECNERNREHERLYRENLKKEIGDRIDNLTIAHRVLLRYGVPDRILNEIATEIDELFIYEDSI